MARPLAEILHGLPDEFPELASGGMVTQLFRAVVLPQMEHEAKRDEGRARETCRTILARLVRLLELTPEELFPGLFSAPSAGSSSAVSENNAPSADTGGEDGPASSSPSPLAQATEE